MFRPPQVGTGEVQPWTSPEKRMVQALGLVGHGRDGEAQDGRQRQDRDSDVHVVLLVLSDGICAHRPAGAA
jgi:hypothetical protein